MKKNPSQTALKVALNLVALSHVDEVNSTLPDGIVNKSIELLEKSGAAKKSMLQKHMKPSIVKWYKLFDKITPGQFYSFASRKAFFEDQTIDAIRHGATQVLALGAGYDTLALRIADKFPIVNFFEIEEPATASLKIRGVERMGKPANLHLISEDLGSSRLSDVLRKDKRWDASKQTVVLAEGLLQYLTADDVKDLFKQCAESIGNNSRFVFTYVRKSENGHYDIGKHPRLLMWLMKKTNEPWLWFTKLSELSPKLKEQGWAYSESLTGETTRSGIEYLGVAEKAPIN